MKIAGIVAEYDPFHNGHTYHLEKTKEKNGGCEATHTVAVMSGSFTERGTPAALSKFDRARMALAGGIDLVLELPVPWALSSAEGFAFGAVSMLNALGCVDTISFGSECGDLAALEKIVTVMGSSRYASLFRYHTGMGISFAEARQKALTEIAGETLSSLLSSPNNTLAVEYLAALQKTGSTITPFTVKRYGVSHDGQVPLGNIASASYLRDLLTNGRTTAALSFVPAPVGTLLATAPIASAAYLERAVLARLRTLSPERLAKIAGVSEGLENRVYNAVRQAGSLAELEEAIKTKRYPLTRVRRLIYSAYIGIPAGYTAFCPPYLRILAANDKGKEILAAAKPTVPLLHRASQIEKAENDVKTLWTLETRATDLHALAFPTPLACGTDYTTGLIRGE